MENVYTLKSNVIMYSVLKFANCRIAAPTSPPSPTEVRTEDVDIQAEKQPVQQTTIGPNYSQQNSELLNCQHYN